MLGIRSMEILFLKITPMICFGFHAAEQILSHIQGMKQFLCSKFLPLMWQF
jgi:hypothetical protein